jgi:AcrR family transcriptional regulator
MTREERRAATRTELLDAAARVFARRGFHNASVNEVAAEAGYTSGAVYSQFESKDDLFLAAFEHDVARYVKEATEAWESGDESPAGRTRAIAKRWMEILRARPEMWMLVIEYWAYAVRDPKQREQFAERFGAFRDTTTRMIEEEQRRGGWDLAEAPEDLALGINALVYGFALQYLAAPDEMDDELLGRIANVTFLGARSAAGDGPKRKGEPPLTST